MAAFGPSLFLKQSNRQGMTLVELLIVVAIMATLAGIVSVPAISFLAKARASDVVGELRRIGNNIELYKQYYNEYPESLEKLGVVPLDPWGNPYQYVRVADASIGKLRKDHNLVPVNTDYDLFSKGADGKSAGPFTAKPSRDDIVRANNGEFFGLVSDY